MFIRKSGAQLHVPLEVFRWNLLALSISQRKVTQVTERPYLRGS